MISQQCLCLVRSCWGPEARHAETVEWFLDNGVPLDDIYDVCMEMTKNSKTKKILEKRKVTAGSGDGAAAFAGGTGDDL